MIPDFISKLAGNADVQQMLAEAMQGKTGDDALEAVAKIAKANGIDVDLKALSALLPGDGELSLESLSGIAGGGLEEAFASGPFSHIINRDRDRTGVDAAIEAVQNAIWKR